MGQAFVNKLSELSGLNFTDKIKLDFGYQIRSWYFKNDIHDDFDFDHDASEEFAEKMRQAKKNE